MMNRPENKKSMPTKRLARLMFVQGGQCFFCKSPLPKVEASIEHLLASSNGGGNNDENCVACCRALNAILGSMPLKDKFQVVLNQKGNFKCPGGVGANSGATSTARTVNSTPLPSAPPKEPCAEKTIPDNFTILVANLNQRGTGRPRTLKTLTSSVASIFPKSVTEVELAALIQELQSTGKVTVNGNKVTYAL